VAAGGAAGAKPETAPPAVALLSVIVPVHNERETIAEALRRVKAAPGEKEIIVVDDASTDGTLALLKADPDIRLLRHLKNQGKGSAIRTALAAATGDVILIQDADLEYDPQEYPRLVEPIRRGEARVVYGSRFLNGRPAMRWPNYLCNRLLALAANLLYGARITDEATCYKVFDATLLRDLPLECRRFEFCPEVTAKVRRRGVRIHEVPITYTARTFDAGKKIRAWDAVEAFWTLLRFRFWK
jgi:dolichol-phosphate mannosyltransferase